MSVRSGLVALLLLVAVKVGASADLRSYVARQDKVFRWEKSSEIRQRGATVLDFRMTSQKWQNIVWEHRILLFIPEKNEFPDTCVVYVTGGDGSDADRMLGTTIANAASMPVAILFNIPNQPLFGGMGEDALIAYTFDQYLQTGDEDWPLLFPMVKSVIRAMDTLQASAAADGRKALKKFVVAGGSKRGWTTWLTAATGDSRVKGIVPIVFDNLNVEAQMPHQLATWGKYSEQIDDYTKRGLQQKMTTERGKKLNALVDPYTFRKSLSLPKLIVNGTNDPYWTLDSLNLYWDALTGPKNVLYGINSGHGMEKSIPAVLAATTAFARTVASGKTLAPVEWKFTDAAEGVSLEIRPGGEAQSARLWTATSNTKDFRKSTWTSQPMDKASELFGVRVKAPDSGYLAVLGEVTMSAAGRSYTVSTQVRILSAK